MSTVFIVSASHSFEVDGKLIPYDSVHQTAAGAKDKAILIVQQMVAMTNDIADPNFPLIYKPWEDWETNLHLCKRYYDTAVDDVLQLTITEVQLEV